MRVVFNHASAANSLQFICHQAPTACMNECACCCNILPNAFTFYLVCCNPIYRLLSIPMDNSFKETKLWCFFFPSPFFHFVAVLFLLKRCYETTIRQPGGRQSPIQPARQHLVLIKYNMPTQVTIAIFLFISFRCVSFLLPFFFCFCFCFSAIEAIKHL